MKLSKIGNFDQSIDLNLAQYLSDKLGGRKLKYKWVYRIFLIGSSFFALLIYLFLLFNPSKLLLAIAYIYVVIVILVITYPRYCFHDSNIFQMKQNVYSEIKNIPFEKLDRYFDLILYSFDKITKKDDQIIKLTCSFLPVALTVLGTFIPSSSLYNIFSNSVEKNINVTLSIVYIVICIGCWVFYISKINRLVANRVRLFLYSILEHKVLNGNI